MYIKNLIMLGIVKKEAPYGEDTTHKTIYSVAYKRIEPNLSDYMGAEDKDTALFAECMSQK